LGEIYPYGDKDGEDAVRQSLIVNLTGEKMSRIYIVGTPSGDVRLIRCKTRRQALSHVATNMFTVRVATQDDLVKTITNGSLVESFKDADQADLDLV
jgi:hypothetical protein